MNYYIVFIYIIIKSLIIKALSDYSKDSIDLSNNKNDDLSNALIQTCVDESNQCHSIIDRFSKEDEINLDHIRDGDQSECALIKSALSEYSLSDDLQNDSNFHTFIVMVITHLDRQTIENARLKPLFE